jgi:hypothetical protein
VNRREDIVEVKLTFRELDLIHRALRSLRTVSELERRPELQELLDDTLQLVDQALVDAAFTRAA